MHDLIRQYAAESAQDLSDDTSRAALRRVLDFYSHTAYAADRLLAPHRQRIELGPPTPGIHLHPVSDDQSAMAWFDAEHANLLAAQGSAIAHGWHSTTWHLAWELTTFHHRRGHRHSGRHDNLTMWQAVVDTSAHLLDPGADTLAHRLLGGAYADLERFDEADQHLHQALVLAEQHDDAAAQALAHRVLAWTWTRRGNDQRAVHHAQAALNLSRGLDQPVWVAEALNAVGWYTARLGDHDTARAHCEAALILLRQHHDPSGQAATLDSLGYIDHHSGHHDRAISRYEQAIVLLRGLDNIYETANTLDNLGHPHVALGHVDQARAVWQEALELYREQGRDLNAERMQQQLDALGGQPAGSAG